MLERVGTLQRVVGDQDGLGGSHRERRAETRGLAVRGHRHERDFTATGLVDQLQRHLDAVGVGVIEDELAGAVEIVVRIERSRTGRVGNLLYTDDDIHALSIADAA